MVRRVAGEAAAPLSRLVELPGRGATRVWECPGPRRAETLMLIHGVAVTIMIVTNASRFARKFVATTSR